MGLKDLFFVSDDSKNEQKNDATHQASIPNVTKFPSVNTNTTDTNISTTPTNNFSTGVSNEHLQQTLELYQNGFDSLNQPGYDFYEFYQSVVKTGPTNPQVYQMALTMANVVDKTLTKDKLIEQAGFYTTEINKVYSSFDEKGNVSYSRIYSNCWWWTWCSN